MFLFWLPQTAFRFNEHWTPIKQSPQPGERSVGLYLDATLDEAVDQVGCIAAADARNRTAPPFRQDIEFEVALRFLIGCCGAVLPDVPLEVVVGESFESLHFWLTCWCLLAMMADGFDLLNASIAGPAIIKEWGISRAALGPVFSASLVGFLVGAPFFGYLGDRYGRRVAIISSLLFVGASTLASAWATDLQELLWLRFISGLALGGVLPNVIALNAEFTPKRLRATALVVMLTGIPLGGAVPGLVGATLMPAYGWPVIFIIGGIVPLVVGLCMIVAIPDSIKFPRNQAGAPFFYLTKGWR